jgi:hypothetical protein
MSTEFPSIWIEIRKKNEKGILKGGFYREWTHKGTNLKKTSKEILKYLQNKLRELQIKTKNCFCWEMSTSVQ